MKVRILGRSVPLAALLLLVVVLTAGAWGIYELLAGGTLVSVGVREGPIPINITWNSPNCQTWGGPGEMVSCDFDEPTLTLSAGFTGMDDESNVETMIPFTNNSGFDICFLDFLPVTHEAYEITANAFPQNVADGATSQVSVQYIPNELLAGYALTTVELSSAFDISACPP